MQVEDAFTIFSNKLLGYFLGQVSDAKASSEPLEYGMFKTEQNKKEKPKPQSK